MLTIDRRRFIQGAMAAVAIGPRALAADAPKWTMRLSTSSIHYRRLPIEQAVERIGKLGFEAIDIWCAYHQCPHLDDALARLGPEKLADLLQRHKLKLFAFSVYVGGYRKYAELLGKCGGGVAIRGSAGPVKAGDLVPSMKKFLEGLKPELDLCEKHNSTLAIENHGNALLDSLDSFKAFADLNQNPRLGIALAPYHVQAAKQSVEDSILACGKQLLFFYAWQNAPGVKQLPGHGPADFKPWLQALAKVEYRGYVNPFMHDEPEPDEMDQALAKARDYLGGCV